MEKGIKDFEILCSLLKWLLWGDGMALLFRILTRHETVRAKV